MTGDMDRWGIGPRFTAFSIGYMVVALIVHFMFLREYTFVLFDRTWNIVVGMVLIIAGVPLFVLPARVIDGYFKRGELCTVGIYSYMRHPLYGAWILFIIPGIIIMVGSYLGLTVPFVMYAVFRVMVGREERYLEGRFGEEYRVYRRDVNAIIPTLWRRR